VRHVGYLQRLYRDTRSTERKKRVIACVPEVTTNNKGKGKAIPLQTWTGSEGSMRMRLPDFKTIGT